MARILVVDDAPFMRRLIRDILTRAGHEVIAEAGNGIEALEQFASERPDVLTLDITMPVKDGLAALQQIIALDADARVVMCSALGTEAKVLEAMKSGARDFVVKPLHPDRLLAAINNALA